MSCMYKGSEYSEGASVCMNGTVHICSDERWVASGAPCDDSYEDSLPEPVKPVIPTQGDWIAKFYEYGDLTGSCLEIKGVGKANGFPDLGRANGKDFNNVFCSAEVKPGYRARAFVNLNFTGSELRLDKDPQHGRANYKPGTDGIMQFTEFPNAPEHRFRNSISSIYCEPYSG